jgi:hypothetical protein
VHFRASAAAAAAALASIFVTGCGAARTIAPVAAQPRDDATAAREWLTHQPEGCALGQSGPTLKPTDAFREARRRARAALVTAVEKIQQKSAARDRARGGRQDHDEVILEQTEGWVRRSTIVALWYDDRGVGPGGAAGTAYAAACLNQLAPESTRAWMAEMERRRAAPAWIYGGPGARGQLCALGVSGPTMNPADAPVNAAASARDELAEALAAHVKLAVGIFDDETLEGAVTQVGEAERARARAASISATWTDANGAGPIPFSGTAYARACLPE